MSNELKKYAESIAKTFCNNLKNKEFARVRLSGNLANTTYYKRDFRGNIVIVIPAEKYDISEYTKTHKIRYTKGSYAESVDKYGGFSGKHTNFIERNLTESIKESLDRAGVEYKVKKG